LHSHSNKVTDEYYAHWDYFSAFALAHRKPNELNRLIDRALMVDLP
jgi:hypothetical protein